MDDLVLMEFFNQQAKDGREIVQVIPLDVGDSLFVTAPLGDRPKPAYLVLPVYEPIEEGRVKDRMGLQKGKTLLGLHRLSADSYALIFGRGRGARSAGRLRAGPVRAVVVRAGTEAGPLYLDLPETVAVPGGEAVPAPRL